VTLMAHN